MNREGNKPGPPDPDAGLRAIVQVLSWALALLITALFLNPVRRILPQDYMQFYFAGRLVVSGNISQIYNREAYQPLVADLRAGGETVIPYHYFNRPAWYAYACAPLALLSYRTGLLLVLLFNFCLLVFLVWKLPAWFPLSPWARPWLFCFLPFLWTVAFDQDTLLLALLVALALHKIRDGREVSAGLLLSLATFKPHLIWLTPLALLSSGKRRALYAFSAASLCLGALSFASVGMAGVRQWIDLLQAPTTDVSPHLMPNLRCLYIRFGWAGLAPALVVFAGSLITVFRRGSLGEQFAGAVLGSLLLSPHTYWQDYAIVAPVVALVPCLFVRWLLLAPWPYALARPDGLPLAVVATACLGLLALGRKLNRDAPFRPARLSADPVTSTAD